ncbi:MAG: hypothetical protein WCH60_13055 [Burkholderiales bacterium]
MKFYLFAVLAATVLPKAGAASLACPELASAVQVGTCPTEEDLKYTFTGFCSDDARAYRGETDVCTDFEQYRKLKNVALWESADGVFDAYVSCDLPKNALKAAKLSGVRVAKQGKLTQLICSYPNGVRFTYRTRALCTADSGVDCSVNPGSCMANCEGAP